MKPDEMKPDELTAFLAWMRRTLPAGERAGIIAAIEAEFCRHGNREGDRPRNCLCWRDNKGD